ncbi:MAG: RNA-binding protein [Nitrosopumilaceae archaeon]|nr:RNA-binding protein [Nitrosopumilaceae archaeon]
MKSNFISKRETSEVLKAIFDQWKITLPKYKNLKMFEIKNYIIFTSDDFYVIKINNIFIPSLLSLDILRQFAHVTIDMNAIKFICNGANIMRPGIVNFTKFAKDDIVCVIDKAHNKFLAVGKSVISSEEMQNKSKGIVIKNLHHIGDTFWESMKFEIN